MNRSCTLVLCLGIISCGDETEAPAAPEYFPFKESQYVEIWIEADDEKVVSNDVWNSSLNYCVCDAQEPKKCGLRRVPAGYLNDEITIGEASDDPKDKGPYGGCTAPDDGEMIGDIVVGHSCRISIRDALPNEYFEVIVNDEPKPASVLMPTSEKFQLDESAIFGTVDVGAGQAAEILWEKPIDSTKSPTEVRLWVTIDDPAVPECGALAGSWGGIFLDVDDDGDSKFSASDFPSADVLPEPDGCQVRVKASRMRWGFNPLGEISGRQTDSKLIQVTP